MFNKDRLTLARRRKKFTKKKLAEMVDIAPLTLTRLEAGEHTPTVETVEKISKQLGFPYEFFYGDEIDNLTVEAVSFRSLSTMTSKDRDSAIASGEIAFMFADWISAKFNLPEADLPDLSADYTPERAAEAVREYWGIGLSPVKDIVKLLESKGVFVFALRENVKTVDAFSCWRSNVPYIFLNSNKTVERTRFDAAHELGHLLMHTGSRLQHGKQIEKEADAFASSFLMPESDVLSQVQGHIKLEELIERKVRWKTSLASLCYRLHKLGRISDWEYRGFCIQINSSYRNSEPNSIGEIRSTLLTYVFEELWKEKVTKTDICNDLNIPLDELEKLINFTLNKKTTNRELNFNRLQLVN